MTVALAAMVSAGYASGAPATNPPVSISQLINEIAGANQTLADLSSDVAAKREGVNRSLVDLQNARDAERLAGVAVRTAQGSVQKASGAVEAAQQKFDELTRAAYKQGNTQNSLSNFVADDPGAMLNRASVLDRLSHNQQGIIKNLQIARNEKANKAATAVASQRQATRATQAAAERKSSAEQAISAAIAAVNGQQQKRDTLISARDRAQAALDAMRAAAGRQSAGTQATTAPRSGSPATAPSTSGSGGQAPAPSQNSPQPAPAAPGAPTQAAAPATPGAPTPAADDTSARDAALQAAAKAAAELAVNGTQQILANLVAAVGGTHTDLDGSAFGSSGWGSDSGNSGDGSTGGGGGGTVQPGITGPAAVEIVVNRAMSQLGVTYAWGGGDANGPTQGIRDGGVADSYGDYNKVGFDCSGLMVYAFAGVGISLPHYTGYQYTAGPQVPLAQMQRGDMIFYGANASEHVAMYLGNNQMIEAPESGDVVKVSPLRTSGAMPYVVRMV
ncbi:NlpC/P60 family protein [Williamsia sterculiae]|uniref:NlpC/P60 family protein n=1 Tax=Williamsia sterculiae TaxID=1344003 RepID=A0A1N7EKQ6_9NOCA|nr:NlpC/P60 family protein [Williamsia sterculiae]SIR88619.1 NlpC/P60 family protein [Williamsia sterculiae]